MRFIWPLLLAACALPEDTAPWTDQVQAEGACYAVDLSDGLSEQSTQELRDLFDCLNQGNLDSYTPLVEATDSPNRLGEASGLDVARLVNHLPDLAAPDSLSGLLEGIVDLLEDPDAPLLAGAELFVELLYGTVYEDLDPDSPPTSPSSLDEGMLVPLVPLAGEIATTVLDLDSDPLDLGASILEHELTADAAATLDVVLEAESGLLATLGDDLPGLAADAIDKSLDTGNDHWEGASGNSLRDLAVALAGTWTAEETLVASPVLDPAVLILTDEAVQAELETVLFENSIEGRLDLLGSQLRYLAQVDVDGDSLEEGEVSALYALIRLLDTGNREVSCSAWGYDIDISENLSVWLLELLAAQDPEDMANGLEIGGFTLGWSSFLDLLESLADNCGLDGGLFAEDAPALARLADDEVDDLLVMMLEFLAALQPTEQDNRIPEFVDLVSAIHGYGITEPVAEVVRDLGDTRVASRLAASVPVLIDPHSDRAWCEGGATSCQEEIWEGYDTAAFPSGTAPLDLDALITVAENLVTVDESGSSPLERFQLILALAVTHDGAWEVEERLPALLSDGRSRLHRLPGWYSAAVTPESSLEGLATSATHLRDRALTDPVLRVVETEEVREAVETTSNDDEGPLPFTARLVTGGTLASVLDTIRILLQYLEKVAS